MPLFDFHCPDCDITFELLVRRDTQVRCPSCDSEAVEKCLSKPAAPGRSKAIIASGRAAAAREGHFSHYAASDRQRALKGA